TKPVTDFHRQDVTHAGRTEQGAGALSFLSSFTIFCYLYQGVRMRHKKIKPQSFHRLMIH
ncbi:hypothetical protein, partial [Staphylococcus pseudintermedius]|uniref:hypothetical protein n=1 Tax=Staphylococcus pseudintermedius TaxID=283734 RepID=UPI0028883355